MDFQEQQALLSELLGDPNTSSDDMFPLARRKAALNRGDIHFTKDSKCVREYATGTVASSEIAMPSGWLETFTLIIDNEVIDGRRELALHDWEKYNDNSDEVYYYIWEYSGTKKMKFTTNSDVNGKTYTLYYFKKQTSALSGNSDESIIPDEYREGPVFWAAYWLLQQIGKMDLAAQNKAQYGNLVAEALMKTEKEYKQKNAPNPDMDTGTEFGGYRQGDGGSD